ncbi:MAG: 16S rRNA (cytosine(1402)-N(4))-methyltransferase RsmH [candidate division Zixibacteria bacterium]|nr:16S rRNA (cytosine(1402)-N(4))-methyltransferase RsmH [candidate division Zixibacteria bacterium]
MIPDANESSHLPVLVVEVVAMLVTNPDGAYLDLTAGAGGHMKALASKLGKAARLYGLDRDPLAVVRTKRNLGDCRQVRDVVHAAYGDLKTVVGQFEDKKFDGILLDLGLSSDQLADAERGFSFSLEGPLDMRFDPESGGPTAAELLNSLSKKDLTAIFRDFGEEKQAARIAAAIVRERQQRMFTASADLTTIVSQLAPPNYRTKALARCFQALRIAVNDELAQLSKLLPIALDFLNTGGRMAVIAYHSLEDRIVKRFFQQAAKGCTCPPRFPVCVCGRVPQMQIITRKPIMPAAEEIASNPRSRSARLRVAERLPV